MEFKLIRQYDKVATTKSMLICIMKITERV